MKNFEEIISIYKSGKLEEVKKICENLLIKETDNFKLLNLLGIVLLDLKFYSQGEKIIKKAININPDHNALYNNLGVIYNELGKFNNAIKALTKSIELKPDNPGAYNNLGISFAKIRKYENAFINYKKAIELNPSYAEAYNNLGILYYEINNYDQAILNFKKAIKINQKYIQAHKNIANAYREKGNYNLTIKYFSELKKIDPKNEFNYELNILINKTKICDWKDFKKICRKIETNILSEGLDLPPFDLLHLIDQPELIKNFIVNFNKKNFLKNAEIIRCNSISKKITIGYYTSDFREHATSRLLASVIENHNKKEFKIIGFNFSRNADDHLTKRLKKSFDEFIDVKFSSDEEIVLLSKKIKVDIAVDLHGHTTNSRPNIFKKRVAPIQVNYLAYPGTVGNYLDYIIADKIVITEADKKFYFEKIVFMPDCYQPNDFSSSISYEKKDQYKKNFTSIKFIYCCFNKPEKINPQIFNVWARILKKTEDTALCILSRNPEMEENILKEIFNRKIDKKRIIFSPPLSYSDYLKRFSYCDLFLDTFPYSAHTVANEALINGLPLISIEGKSFQSRVASSLLQNLGLNELVMKNTEDYENFAIKMSKYPEKLANIKQKLISSIKNTNTFNNKIYTKNLEKGYKEIYDRYRKDLLPDHIYIK